MLELVIFDIRLLLLPSCSRGGFLGGEAVLGRMDGDGVCSLAEVFEEDSTSDEVELDTVECKDEKSIIGVGKMIKRLYYQYLGQG